MGTGNDVSEAPKNLQRRQRSSKRMFRLELLLLLVSSCAAEIEWANDFDGQLFFECPEGETISHLLSMHDNGAEDRRWGFECKPVADFPFDSCSWTGYVNNFDETFVYECTTGAGVITGMESEHDNHHEDRRWSYKCCAAQVKLLSERTSGAPPVIFAATTTATSPRSSTSSTNPW